jgi:heat shock protein HslJ
MRPIHRTIIPAAMLTVLMGATAMAASPSPAASPASPPFLGRTWVLGTYLAADGGYTGAVAPVDLRFDAELSGSTGCEDFHGPWSTDGTDLTIGPLTTSDRTCTGDLGDQDAAIRAALDQVRGFRLSDGLLDLVDGSGSRLLSYVNLEGRSWWPLLDDYETKPGVVLSIAFLDGIVSGQAPCNQFSATYRVDGKDLSVGPISTTSRDCPDIAAEQRLLDTLRKARSWDFRTNLVLSDAAGTELGEFSLYSD